MHDTLTPLGGMVPLLHMMLNCVFGGKGVGLMNMIMYVILAVFLCGLMIGRTPEYLGKKIEGKEMKLVALVLIIHPLLILGLLGILILSLWTSRRFVSVSAALASVLLFDLLFVDPLYSFAIHLKGYTATFLIMLLFSLIISTIISTGRKQARESTKQMYRTQLLLDNSRRMRRVDTVKGLLLELSGQILKLMDLPVVFFTIQEEKMAGPWLFPRTGMTKEELRKMVDDQERAVAEWVAANGKRAGCCTHTLPGAKAMYLPIKTSDKTYAVMGIVLEERREIPAFEYGLLTAMVNEAALVFARILKEKEK